MVECSECHTKEYNFDDSDEKCTPGLGLNMCTRTGMKHVYQNWDETCVPELGLNMRTRGSRGRAPGKL
jgi:hypothetical protein